MNIRFTNGNKTIWARVKKPDGTIVGTFRGGCREYLISAMLNALIRDQGIRVLGEKNNGLSTQPIQIKSQDATFKTYNFIITMERYSTSELNATKKAFAKSITGLGLKLANPGVDISATDYQLRFNKRSIGLVVSNALIFHPRKLSFVSGLFRGAIGAFLRTDNTLKDYKDFTKEYNDANTRKKLAALYHKISGNLDVLDIRAQPNRKKILVDGTPFKKRYDFNVTARINIGINHNFSGTAGIAVAVREIENNR